MMRPHFAQPFRSAHLAWLSAVLFGVVAPWAAMWLLDARAGDGPIIALGGPILAVGLMGVGMIGAAAAASVRIGVLCALLNGAGLLGLGWALGLPLIGHPLPCALAMIIASLSFAVRGALFARSAGDKGWWIAVFVVTGEVAILATAMALPAALPAWLLVLLPAQWASVSIQTALAGTPIIAAGAALAALVGTAAATHLVASLWPRRWPYLVMFTAWLCFSALVWHYPAPPVDGASPAAPAVDQPGKPAPERS